jgi:hypothetical protein
MGGICANNPYVNRIGAMFGLRNGRRSAVQTQQSITVGGATLSFAGNESQSVGPFSSIDLGKDSKCPWKAWKETCRPLRYANGNPKCNLQGIIWSEVEAGTVFCGVLITRVSCTLSATGGQVNSAFA